MKVFSWLYTWMMGLARHKRAPFYLSALSVAESSFFPIPPDVMLAPMALAKPQRAWFYAGLTTVASIVGGVIGYFLGHLAFTSVIEGLLYQFHYYDTYLVAVGWFESWGVWVVLLAGFSPIPYKLFTIASGALQMPFLPFLLASIVGRGARFFLVAGLMRWGGERLEQKLHSWVDRIGWGMVFLVAGFAVWRYGF